MIRVRNRLGLRVRIVIRVRIRVGQVSGLGLCLIGAVTV